VLIQRAQSRIDQAPLEGEVGLGRAQGCQTRPSPQKESEGDWREHG
jgi:hypothetical protein